MSVGIIEITTIRSLKITGPWNVASADVMSTVRAAIPLTTPTTCGTSGITNEGYAYSGLGKVRR